MRPVLETRDLVETQLFGIAAFDGPTIALGSAALVALGGDAAGRGVRRGSIGTPS